MVLRGNTASLSSNIMSYMIIIAITLILIIVITLVFRYEFVFNSFL